ncbi:MAG: STAS domain-containing protein [Rubrobacteridae bacterium]|nr:STAS domain-containing protein [Rubrobacteridae bacterium]
MAEKEFPKPKSESEPLDDNIRFEFERQDSTLLIRLYGEADLVGSSKLKQAIAPNLAGVNKAVFDLSEVVYVDSYFLRFLLKLRKRLGNVSSVRVINANPNVTRIFEITGLNKLFMH